MGIVQTDSKIYKKNSLKLGIVNFSIYAVTMTKIFVKTVTEILVCSKNIFRLLTETVKTIVT